LRGRGARQNEERSGEESEAMHGEEARR
jgi:hypothetical protein